MVFLFYFSFCWAPHKRRWTRGAPRERDKRKTIIRRIEGMMSAASLVAAIIIPSFGAKSLSFLASPLPSRPDDSKPREEETKK
jgi:hypothetical protein